MSVEARCLCGAVRVELQGRPAARAYCHCATCRDFYGTSLLSATAWDADAVRLTAGEGAVFQHPHKQLSKTFCTVCGEVVFGTNRLGMRVIPSAMLARASGGQLDPALTPQMHLFYRDRVLDAVDDLPKYLDGWDGPLYVATT